MAGSLIVISLAASALFVVLVLLAHILNPEIDARWRALSELSIGGRGWVMNVAFLAWSASNIALALAIWSVVPLWTSLALVIVSLGPLGLHRRRGIGGEGGGRRIVVGDLGRLKGCGATGQCRRRKQHKRQQKLTQKPPGFRTRCIWLKAGLSQRELSSLVTVRPSRPR